MHSQSVVPSGIYDIVVEPLTITRAIEPNVSTLEMAANISEILLKLGLALALVMRRVSGH